MYSMTIKYSVNGFFQTTEYTHSTCREILRKAGYCADEHYLMEKVFDKALNKEFVHSILPGTVVYIYNGKNFLVRKKEK
jgi:hypothetical protein